MLLFYFAVLLILVGLFVVFLATESVRVRAKKGDHHAFLTRESAVESPAPAGGVSSPSHPCIAENSLSSAEYQHSSSGGTLPSSVAQGGNVSAGGALSAPAAVPPAAAGPAPSETERPSEKTLSPSVDESGEIPPYVVKAVLYEDRDSVVSLTGGAETIDVDRFNRLTRIASGEFALSADNLIFRSEETMYRFDFSRIKKIEGDKNALLVYPDSLSYPLLFLGLVDEPLAARVLGNYTEHARNAQR